MSGEFQGRIPEIDYIFEARDVQQIVDRSRRWLDRMSWSSGFDTTPVRYWFHKAYENKAVRVDDFFPVLLFYALCGKVGMREDVIEECMRCAVSYTRDNNIDLAGWLSSLGPGELDENQARVAKLYMRLHGEMRRDEIRARRQRETPRETSRRAEPQRLMRISPGRYRSNLVKCLAVGFVVGLILGFLLHAAFSGIGRRDDGVSVPVQQGSYQPSQESQSSSQNPSGMSDSESSSPKESPESKESQSAEQSSQSRESQSAEQSSQSKESQSEEQSSQSGESKESASEESEDESSLDSRKFTAAYTALISSPNGRVRIRSKAELDDENVVAYIQSQAKVTVEVDEKTIEAGGEKWRRIRLTEKMTTDTAKGIEVKENASLAKGEVYYVAERFLSRTTSP